MWYEFFKYALFGPGVRALWHPRVVGEENIPTEGGVILACNHIAALDPIIVASMIDRKLTYPAKKKSFLLSTEASGRRSSRGSCAQSSRCRWIVRVAVLASMPWVQ